MPDKKSKGKVVTPETSFLQQQYNFPVKMQAQIQTSQKQLNKDENKEHATCFLTLAFHENKYNFEFYLVTSLKANWEPTYLSGAPQRRI